MLLLGCVQTEDSASAAAAVAGDTALAASVTEIAESEVPDEVKCACCPIEEDSEKLCATVDFSQSGEIALAVCSLKVHGGRNLDVYDLKGNKLASFKLDGNGKLVPGSSQPSGNIVKSAYSGPPGDLYSCYRVYPSNYKTGSGIEPYIAIDHCNGCVNVTPGDQVTRTHARSRGEDRRRGGSAGAGCATSSGGGGG